MSSARHIDQVRVRRQFSCHATEYDRYAQVQKRVVAALLERVARHWSIGEGAALDVGTGTGELAAGLLGRWPRTGVVACDLAHDMTLQAASKVSGVVPCDSDAQALPFRSGCFDLVVSSSVYQWMSDLPRAFGESVRVLRPEGLFAFALFGAETLRELRQAHRQALKEVGKKGRSHVHEFPGGDQVAEAVQQSGLEMLEFDLADEVEWQPDVATHLRHLKRIGAQNSSTSRPSGLASRRVMERMMAIYTDHHGTSRGIPATYQVIYGLARKAG